MPKTQDENPLVAIVIILVLLFVVGGYLTAWWAIQKILFFQSMFWFTFYGTLLLVLGSIFFFVWFLIKENNHNGGFYGSEPEFFDKKVIGFFSLGCFIVALIFFVMMLSSYEKGFSNESIQKLAESEKKLAEFNYIKDVLTGVEIERLMTENFDIVMEEICNENPSVDCNLLIQNYRQVKDIFEAKEKADDLMYTLRLIESN